MVLDAARSGDAKGRSLLAPQSAEHETPRILRELERQAGEQEGDAAAEQRDALLPVRCTCILVHHDPAMTQFLTMHFYENRSLQA